MGAAAPGPIPAAGSSARLRSGEPAILVYGDSSRSEAAEDVRSSVRRAFAAASAAPPGIEAHALLVAAFVRAAELVQGLADAEFERSAADRPSAAQAAGAELLAALAREVDRSWRRGLRGAHGLFPDICSQLDGLALPSTITTRAGEGYAHYALYPETYLEAGRRSGLGADTCVIGIRSIGLGLAAMVAAALGAAPPVSVRPVGHPFAREISADAALVTPKAARQAPFAIVDEGPGLSGSSFAAVVSWLGSLGVETSRIHLFPSHGGPPGAAASAATLAAWNACRKHVADFDAEVLGAGGGRLRPSLRELLRSDDFTLTDVSGGRWRRIHWGSERHWPPCDPRLERRKFLAVADGRSWLVKFAGLGGIGQRKAELARRLHAGGFGAEVAGLCHGFLVERWEQGAPLDVAGFDRQALVAWLGDYLGMRAGSPAPYHGASPDELRRMAVHNTREGLGEPAADRLGRWFSEHQPAAEPRPAAIDGRLHRWEFLVRPDGSLLKTDALDHCLAHDLVGFQDIAWDVAGASVEHGLSAVEDAALCARIGAVCGRTVDETLVRFYRPCYLAFQLGLWTLAAGAAEGESAALRTTAAGYANALEALLAESGGRRVEGG